MSQTINDLRAEQAELLDKIYWCIDEDDQAEIERQLERIQGDVMRKVEFLTGVYAEAKAQVDARTIVRDNAERRLKTARNAQERLKNFIIDALKMAGQKRAHGALCDLTMYQVAVLRLADDFDIASLPPEFVKVVPETREPKKREILAALKQGEHIEGAEIAQSDVLKII
jgi:hypothetical protein